MKVRNTPMFLVNLYIHHIIQNCKHEDRMAQRKIMLDKKKSIQVYSI